MRTPEYLSPSALDCSESTPDEYYMRYLSDFKPPKMAQTLPMAVGSAFDAYIKSYLHNRLYGNNHKDSERFKLRALFEAQVEEHNRTEAWAMGAHVFESYIKSGSGADLMLMLSKSLDDVRFEFSVQAKIASSIDAGIGISILGKPDLYFRTAENETVIFDFKVNGYCGAGNTSPTAGYVQLIEQSIVDRGNWYRMGCHKNAFIQRHKGLDVNMGSYFESHNAQWATQLATYSWLVGGTVGREQIVGIQQIVGNGTKRDSLGRPLLRIATHCSRISAEFQRGVLDRYSYLWSKIQSGHFFPELSKAESDAKCAQLDRAAKLMASAKPGSLESYVTQWGRE